MKTYIIKRLLSSMIVIVGITIMTFTLLNLSSLNAVDIYEQNTGTALTESQRAEMEEEYGLDQPVYIQYINWLKGFLSGDMGTSYITGEPVFSRFVSKLPSTILLMFVSIVLTLLISIPLGMICALYHNRCIDYFVRFLTFIGNSLPNFFVGFLLMYIFSLKLKLLPVISVNGITGVILPALTLVISMSSKYIRQTRILVLEEMDKDYIIAAKMRGINTKTILSKLVFKSILPSLMTLVVMSIGSLLGGSAVIESIFMYDGAGKMAIDAIMTRDFPVIQVYVIYMALIFVGLNLLSDLFHYFIDPQIRRRHDEKEL